MKLILLVLASTILAGCLQTFKMNPPWPQVPDQAMVKQCENLHLANTQDVSMAELIDLVQQNYQLYHLCKLNNDSWVKWYNTHWKKEK
jgi:hypothetical protein